MVMRPMRNDARVFCASESRFDSFRLHFITVVGQVDDLASMCIIGIYGAISAVSKPGKEVNFGIYV